MMMNANKELLKEQTILLYKGLPATAGATIAVSLLTAAMLNSFTDHLVLIIWTVLLILISLGRGTLFLAFKHHSRKNSYPDYNLWERRFFYGTAASGLVWGSAGIIFFIPGDHAHQAILSLVLGGLAAGAVTSLSYRLLPAMFFINTTTLPIIAMLMLEGTYYSTTLGLLVILLLLFSARSSFQLNQSSTENLLTKISSIRDKNDLIQSQKKLSLHIEKTPLAFIEWDLDFKVTEWNKAAEQIFGYTREESLGKPSAIFPESFGFSIIRQSMNESRESGLNSIENITKDGRSIFCEWHNTQLIDNFGNIIGVASIVKDVTTEREITNDLIKAREEAEKANLSKSEFLSRMSHELRTPLNAILGFSQLLKMNEAGLTSEQEDDLNHIIRAGEHLLELINEVLDLARVESGKMETIPEVLNISDLISEIISLVNPLASAANITIDYTAKDKCNITSDRLKLKEVLINIISNAIKYNSENGNVKIVCRNKTANILLITVTDTGKGISEENINLVFEPFTRVGLHSSSIEGSGIGLTIAKKIIELLGGRIGLESEIGKGSTFWIEIPGDN